MVRTLENDAKIAGARVESLRAASRASRCGRQGQHQRGGAARPEREAKSQREQLESYLARYREAAARDAENASRLSPRGVP